MANKRTRKQRVTADTDYRRHAIGKLSRREHRQQHQQQQARLLARARISADVERMVRFWSWLNGKP